jgi:hypothetical protein
MYTIYIQTYIYIIHIYIYCIEILYEYDYRSNLYTNRLFATLNTYAKQFVRDLCKKIAREDNSMREDDSTR